jgi:hypothetical protein
MEWRSREKLDAYLSTQHTNSRPRAVTQPLLEKTGLHALYHESLLITISWPPARWPG